ncbi:DNA-directed RNA polymerase I subunit RPA34 isoform X1 [Sphaerodactylus townsendi]|uniref:DNA-directed RNA polymerase I subunit RPA34 isoform X1 n=2 Tax=Sphaerodactylus townsendi TaxID=933632 RepID=UPI0020268E77|nr:DNA-directed RNA polymerase I subunit RPA34 isoform X1 [Sphaerodactylus townsendi]
MEVSKGPPRFKRPADFSASPFCSGLPLAQEMLEGSSKELWLIRAPASFSPESLSGHSVPLLGFQTLKASQPDSAKKTFHIQTTLEHLGGAQLLLPLGHGDHLTCSIPFSSSLSICEKYGGSSNSQSLFPVVARPAPQIPGGLRQRFLPFGNRTEGSLLARAAEEPPRKKKKTKKKHRLGKEDYEEDLALFGMPLEVASGAGKAEARQQHVAAPLANGSQPSSAAFAQNGLLSGEVEVAGPRKKKKKKKRKEGELKEMEAEARQWHWHEQEGAATSFPEAQPNSAAFAQDGLLSSKVEAAGPRRRKKRKKAGELKDKSREEAEAAHPLQNVTIPWAVSSQPSSGPAALHSFLSSEPENLDPRSKKKKRDREVKDKMGEVEGGLLDVSPCVGGDFEPQAGAGSLLGMEEMTQLTNKGKRNEKAVPIEPASNKEEAAGAQWDLSGLGASHEGCLVLVQEEPGVGSSDHKAKKKENPEEGALELGEQPALLEVESWAQLGTPLWGGGGGQATKPAMELLSRKPKKKKRPRQEAVE